MSLANIVEKYPTENDAINHFEKVRWNGKVICPYCNSEKIGARHKDYRYRCKSCGGMFSATTKTILHDSRLSLKKWFMGISLIVSAKKGMSALQLKRDLDITYKTAWAMYHKIRNLMQQENDSMPKLKGVLEMDETFVGGKPRKPFPTKGKFLRREERDKFDAQKAEMEAKGFDFRVGIYKKKAKTDSKRGRGTSKKSITGIVERDGNVIAEVMKTLSHEELKAMVKRSVDLNKSVLLTDDYKGYSKMDKIIDHIKLDHKTFYSYKGLDNNTIESFWAIIKRGIMGQYHQVSEKYLPNYVAEFVYKYNRRKEKDTDKLFEEVIKKIAKSKI
jgi:transposase-like protein